VLKGMSEGSNTTVARPLIIQQQAAAATIQVVLLAALTVGTEIGPVGWLAGIAYSMSLWAMLAAAFRSAVLTSFGPANLVTLIRAALVGTVTALVTDGLFGGDTQVAALVVIASVALVLDAVDGRVARRSGTVSELGARFDMEVDAFLILVLSVHVAVLIGPWVLAIGAMRYVFVAASWLAPWLRATLPPRYSAKVVAAGQGITLVVVTSGVLPRPLALAAVSLALALLSWSFGRDVRWLWRHRRPARSGLAHAARAHAYK
jgi:phosphatidylglycerophosphate synthase